MHLCSWLPRLSLTSLDCFWLFLTLLLTSPPITGGYFRPQGVDERLTLIHVTPIPLPTSPLSLAFNDLLFSSTFHSTVFYNLLSYIHCFLCIIASLFFIGSFFLYSFVTFFYDPLLLTFLFSSIYFSWLFFDAVSLLFFLLSFPLLICWSIIFIHNKTI